MQLVFAGTGEALCDLEAASMDGRISNVGAKIGIPPHGGQWEELGGQVQSRLEKRSRPRGGRGVEAA